MISDGLNAYYSLVRYKNKIYVFYSKNQEMSYKYRPLRYIKSADEGETWLHHYTAIDSEKGELGVNVLSASYLYQEAEGTLLGEKLAFSSAFATLCIPLGQILFGVSIEIFAVHIDWIIYITAAYVFCVTLLVRWNVL